MLEWRKDALGHEKELISHTLGFDEEENGKEDSNETCEESKFPKK